MNGRLMPADRAGVPAGSRAFRYGYGLFETMLVRDGRIRLAEYHWDRLRDGMKALNFAAPGHFFNEIEDALYNTVARNGHEELSMVRLQVWPSSGGYYEGDAFTAAYCIETLPLAPEFLKLNADGLVVGIAEGLVKHADTVSHLKTCSSLIYALAARQAGDRGWDDALVLNQYGNVSDSTIANVFWVAGDKIYTPPLSEGCITGVMRRHVLKEFPKWGYAVEEQAVDIQTIRNAEAVFLTNSIRGIRWVKECDGNDFSQSFIAELYGKLLSSF